MRRLLLLSAALAALAVPAVAAGSRSDPGDGTLAVRKASGDTLFQPVMSLVIAGAVVGDLERGRIVVFAAFGPQPVVTAADGTVATPVVRGDGALVYTGSGLRFRAVGGTYKLRLFGRGIDVNAVGQGHALLDGSSGAPTGDGMFSLDGGAWASLPATATLFAIGA